MKTEMWMLGLTLGILLLAQDAPPDRVTVPFRDPSRPGTLNVSLLVGSVTVRGYDGKEAIVESTPRGGDARRHGPRRQRSEPPPGMHRIDTPNAGLDVTEDNNVIKVTGGVYGYSDVTIQVPVQTSLNLKTVSGGRIVVENVSGESNAEDVTGSITITNASGSVLAHSMNGRITVALNQVTPDKSMSFSTMNGPIDVTLPADVKARLKMKTDNGDVFTDFDVKVDPSSRAPILSDGRGPGRYHFRVDRSVYGTINGGGPEMQFITFNGNITIHKK